MTAIRGTVAEPGGTQELGPSGPPLIAASGRVAPSFAVWKRPLTPGLWRRLPKPKRAAHEQLAKSCAAAIARTRDLTTQLRAQREADESTLQDAAQRGAVPPPPAAVDVARQLEEAEQRER